ncbi:MAG TPA: SDR family NAD(P)-dependent oxidoreductase [Candidatus Eisenbacteria bacterium]|jgi:3-oxoacyl-[acyl-carrier protein] reductase
MTEHTATRRVGLVTGGARGIGLEIARVWALRGVTPAVVDCDPYGEARVREACAPYGTAPAYYAADVRDHARAEAVVEDLVERFGRLDYLVLNAGITRDRVSWKMSEAEWDDVIAVNLKGAFNYVRAAVPRLRTQGAGRVVFVSSINGLRGKFGQANYAASKAGLIGYARSLALELGTSGITVNVVAPGMIRTRMTDGLPAAVRERAQAETLLGRLGEPEDVAEAVDFLCRDESRHVTGTVLRVDGGQALAAESA